MHRQNVVYPCDRKSFNLETEGNSDTFCNIHEPWGHYVKKSKPGTKEHILYDSTYLRSLKQSNSLRQKMDWWPPGRGEEEWGVSV